MTSLIAHSGRAGPAPDPTARRSAPGRYLNTAARK